MRTSINKARANVLRESAESVNMPILSIAVPTYKRFDLLKETLDSVFALNFSVPVEILVVDNDPDDLEQALLEMSHYRNNSFAYYKNAENLGAYGNWNQCLALARGKYITILHDDDLLLPEFAAQINTLLRNEGIPHEIVSFAAGILDLRKDRPLTTQHGVLRQFINRFIHSVSSLEVEIGIADLFFANKIFGTLGVVMNREMALSLNGFNADYYPVADYDFWCRWVIHFGNINVIQKKVGLYRLQQNDSLKPEVRIGVLEGSTDIRKRLVSQSAVPLFFKMLIGITAAVQTKSVNLDWLTKNETDPIIFRTVWLRCWRLVTMSLGFLARKSFIQKGKY